MGEELKLQLQEEDILDISLDEDSTLNIDMETDTSTETERNYNNLYNKPSINNIELMGNRSLDDLDIQIKGNYPDEALTNQDIENILNNFA